jgi:molybdenum cofactor synthesis domain-containing protein
VADEIDGATTTGGGPAGPLDHVGHRSGHDAGAAHRVEVPGEASPPGWHARVVVVSDGVASGEREDRGGPALRAALADAGAVVDAVVVSPDGVEAVADTLRAQAAGFDGLLVTTGGTGFGPRDLTPEGTRRVIEREAPGLAEAMRLVSPLGRLSRGIAGTTGGALVLNVPGSPSGAVECLGAVLDVVPHALALLRGDRPH